MEKKRNKKLIKWGLKLKSKKQRGQWCTLPVRREKRGGGNQTTIDDNPTTVSYHVPLQMKEDTEWHGHHPRTG
jgi:hypothetical protein